MADKATRQRSRYRIETTTPNGQQIYVPIPDEWLQKLLDDHTRKQLKVIRQRLVDDGYDAGVCVCEGCTACLVNEMLELIDPDRRSDG